ncbi:hypothetical protein O181_012665 [Austropuccinia psidii MF-1]|uniref:Uncharacterized protein n=1 Tax=Austropuccinia psidii MF-1 TaxID=1389203 RepID=A0A9Q3BYF0_9BASI|nr:hypothetical protein [Austropuccinia psidii MF-1]
MKCLLLEVEVTTQSNKMDLNQEIQVITQKDKNVSPEERHKWRIPNLSPVPKVQELFDGSKEAGVGISTKSLDSYNELLYSSEEAHGPRKDSRPSEGLQTHILQRKGPKDKSFVKIPKHFVRGQEERVLPKEGQQPSGSSSSLHKQ